MALPHPPFRRPTRRVVLRGGAALATSAVTPAIAAAEALRREPGPRPGARDGTGPLPDSGFPGTEWFPADASNFTPARRPADHPVEFVVIHVAQATYEDTAALFQDPSADVSAHYVVASGEARVAQCLREADIGWHAGDWDCNTRSIGIEHEGWVDDPAWFSDGMYQRSAALTGYLCDRYGIPKTRDHIIGHHEVPGATHTDPGPLWDWTRYLRLVNSA